MKRILLFVFIWYAALVSISAQNFAIRFDGTSNYIQLPSTFMSNTFTVEAWVNADIWAVSAYQVIIGNSQTGGWALYLENNKLIGDIWVNTGYVSVSCDVSGLSGWNQVAFTADGTSSTLYINGKLSGTATTNGTFGAPTAGVTETFIGAEVGADNGCEGHYFNGLLDEIRIWNYVRTEAEIKANIFKELAGTETGLTAYYKMGDGSGAILTDNKTGGTNSGTIINNALWQTSGCFAGPRTCLDFDGIDDYVDCGNTASLRITGKAISLEAWIYPTDFQTGYWKNTIIGKDAITVSGYVFRYGGTGQLDFTFGDGSTWRDVSSPTNMLVLNKWQHVACTYDGSFIKLFVNGKEVASGSQTASITNSANNLNIGGSPQAWTDGGNNNRRNYGQIDEVRIWNIVRSESEIKENMMKTLTGNETGLAAYYRFDFIDGTTLYDMTTNANNGTLTNMDVATDWVTSNAFNTWVGSESNSWSSAVNWSKGSIPVSSDNVGIYKWQLGNESAVTGAPTVNNLLVSSTSSPTLGTITVNGNLTLGKDLDLSGQTITLGPSGLLDEGSYRLFGTSGIISTTRSLSNISAQNIGGLGAIITTSANMGSTVITRGHAQQSGNANHSILRYYDITPTTNTGLNATLVFNYKEAELNSISESNLKLFRSTDNGSIWTIQNGTVDAANNKITLSGINGFGRWTLGDINNPLPVELSSFTAYAKGFRVSINWTTATEVSNHGFDVECRLNGNEWTTIGFVKGNGNSNSPKAYSFVDAKSKSGKAEYRLKQIDNDGKFKYSNTIEVSINTPTKFELYQNYPNPFNPGTTISFSLPADSRVDMAIYDVLGKKVVDLVNGIRTAGYQNITFDGGKLASGIYIYTIKATSIDGKSSFTSTRKMMLVK